MLYSYNIYKEMAVRELKSRLGGENVRVVEVAKNNGVKMEGVQMNRDTVSISPILYFSRTEDVYDDLDVIKFVESAVEIYHNAQTFANDSFKNICSWEKVKEHVIPRIVNYERNKDCIKDCPYIKIMDLAVLFVLQTEEIVPEYGDGVIRINDTLMGLWKMDKESLYEQAIKNLEESDYYVKSMEELLGIKVSGQVANNKDAMLYIVTTFDGIGGASVMLSQTILKAACEKIECEKVFILPSSIHELLLVNSEKMGVADLQQMVKGVNSTVLEPQDYLSDNVYVYESGEIRIAKEEDSYKQKQSVVIGNIA